MKASAAGPASSQTALAGRQSATLGIDLASQPENTGACRIDWFGEHGVVNPFPDRALTDDVVLDLIRDPAVTKVGIDAPFGWPTAFVDALIAYRHRLTWPDGPGSREVQLTMELRATDRAVWKELGVKPLGVAVDHIAYAAMRCARLLAALSQEGECVDRSGDGRLVEVYPAAALRCWGLSPGMNPEDPGGYKGKKPEPSRRRRLLVSRLLEETAGWLQIPDPVIEDCRKDDNAFDALICALIARAADLGRLFPVGDAEKGREEGWIRLPHRTSLRNLGSTDYIVEGHHEA